jgi:hypothetical protein
MEVQMSSRSNDKGGSFRAVRDHHLPMFDRRHHRHERGCPHAPQPAAEDVTEKTRWKTIGIFHFRPDDDADG